VTAVAGLLLAAGSGTRFGQPKALVELDGELLVTRAARLLADGGCAPVVVVLGACAADVQGAVRLPSVVVADDWETGMAPRSAPAWPPCRTASPPASSRSSTSR
jgi:nicotine blue oxidoreductase